MRKSMSSFLPYRKKTTRLYWEERFSLSKLWHSEQKGHFTPFFLLTVIDQCGQLWVLLFSDEALDLFFDESLQQYHYYFLFVKWLALILLRLVQYYCIASRRKSLTCQQRNVVVVEDWFIQYSYVRGPL